MESTQNSDDVPVLEIPVRPQFNVTHVRCFVQGSCQESRLHDENNPAARSRPTREIAAAGRKQIKRTGSVIRSSSAAIHLPLRFDPTRCEQI